MYNKKIRKIFSLILLVGILFFWSAPLWAAPAFYNGQPVEIPTSYDQNFAGTKTVSFPVYAGMTFTNSIASSTAGMACDISGVGEDSFAELRTVAYDRTTDTENKKVWVGLAKRLTDTAEKRWCATWTKVAFDTRSLPDNAIITDAWFNIESVNGGEFYDWFKSFLSVLSINNMHIVGDGGGGYTWQTDENTLYYLSHGRTQTATGKYNFLEIGERMPFWYATSTRNFVEQNGVAVVHTPYTYNFHSGLTTSYGDTDGLTTRIDIKPSGLTSISKNDISAFAFLPSSLVDNAQPQSRAGFEDVSSHDAYLLDDDNNDILGMQLVVQYTYNQIPLPGVNNMDVAIKVAVFIFFLLLVDLIRRFYQNL